MTYRLGDSSPIEPKPLAGKAVAAATVQDTQPEQGGISAELRHFQSPSWTPSKPRVAIVADEEVAALLRGRAWEPMIWQVGSFWYADAGQLARWREQRAAGLSA